MVTQKRGSAIADLLSSGRSNAGAAAPASSTVSPEMETLFNRIKEGRIIPIVSNAIALDGVFSALIDQAASATQGVDADAIAAMKLNAENIIAEGWAEEIGYPFPDASELARVAQYNRWKKIPDGNGNLVSKDDETSNREFLDALKDFLLTYADKVMHEPSAHLDDLDSRKKGMSFDEMAAELKYPRYADDSTAPLRILARFPLPIYLTTSPFKFLENALLAEGKTPCTQVCMWSPDAQCEEVNNDPAFAPTVAAPLVYHLYGLDRCPATMLLSEDHYLDFLVNLALDNDVTHPIIPVGLRSKVAVASLFLLGYRVQDLDFRVLFRGIVAARQNTSAVTNLILQLDPMQQYSIRNDDDARGYLMTYFQPKLFEVEWGKTEDYLAKLSQDYNQWIQTL